MENFYNKWAVGFFMIGIYCLMCSLWATSMFTIFFYGFWGGAMIYAGWNCLNEKKNWRLNRAFHKIKVDIILKLIAENAELKQKIVELKENVFEEFKKMYSEKYTLLAKGKVGAAASKNKKKKKVKKNGN